MEGMFSSSDQQRLVSSFLEIAVGQTAETARQFLEATSWKLEEALQLFFVGGECVMLPSGTHTQPASDDHMAEISWGEEPKRPGVWESDEGASSASASATDTASAPRDSLASLYRPTFHLMLHGSFEQKENDLERFEKAKLYTNISTICGRKLKGYHAQGFYVSTKLKCLEENSKDAQDVPYTKWLVDMDSKVRKVGDPFSYWDISTHMKYKNSRFWKDPFKVNLRVDNKPKVSGDISLGLHSAKLITSFGAPDFLESMKLDFLCFHEHIGLRVSGAEFKKEIFITPRRIDASVAVYGSCLKFGAQTSFAVESDKPMRERFTSGFGGSLKTNNIMASIIYWRNQWNGSLVKHFRQFDLGIEVSKLISSNQYTCTLGACIPKSEQEYKVKVNNSGVISGLVESKWGLNAVVSVSAQMDLKNVSKCPKVGVKVLFRSSAHQTYDVGLKDWKKPP